MKKIFLLHALLFLPLMLLGQTGHAERAIQRFTHLYNLQQFDSVYDLFAASFKAKFPPQVNQITLKRTFELNGKANSAALIRSDGGKFIYRIDCERGSIEATLATDDVGKINSFGLVPSSQNPPRQSIIFPTDNPRNSAIDKSIDAEVQRFLNSTAGVGLSIAVVDGSNVTFYNYGETSKGSGRTPSKNSIYDIGSITKTFTASTIARFIERGLLDLKDSVGKFVEGMPSEIASIKIGQLLNHTSGLQSMPPPPEKVVPGKDPFEKYDRQQLMADLKSINLQSKPGEKFAYSNLGFAILGVVLEEVAGKACTDVIKDELITPQQLNATQWNNNLIRKSDVTTGHQNGKPVNYTLLDVMNPAGGLKSNAVDMVKYLEFMLQQGTEPLPLVERITFTTPNNIGIGLAWLSRDINGSTIYFHNGGTVGYRSFAGFDAKNGRGVIVLSNSTADVTNLGFSILKLK